MAQRGTDHQRTDSLRQMLVEQRQAVLYKTESLLIKRRQDQQQQREEAVLDAGDLALHDYAAEQDLALVQQHDRLRQQYDLALQRLDEGRYGVCEDCGTSIADGRLRVAPFAHRCVPCQKKAEEIDRIEREPDRRQI